MRKHEPNDRVGNKFIRPVGWIFQFEYMCHFSQPLAVCHEKRCIN